jgi:hypothetical protein
MRGSEAGHVIPVGALQPVMQRWSLKHIPASSVKNARMENVDLYDALEVPMPGYTREIA